MRLCLLGKNADYVLAYRGSLIRAAQARGHEVHAITATAHSDAARTRLAAAGVTLHEIPLQGGGTNPLRDLASQRALRRVLRAIRPDALFCYNPKGVAYGPPAARAAGVPRVAVMVTGLGYAFTGRGLRRRAVAWVAVRLFRRALRSADVAFFHNHDDLSEFHILGVIPPGTDVRMVAGSGVDLERFAASPVPPGIRFLMVARILRDKGAPEFVEAAREVKAACPQATFELLGGVDDNPTAVPAAEVEAWRREGVVELPGETVDVRPHLRACTVFVLPSHREGTSKVMLEALSTGRAVITTDAPGCREPVAPGVNGLLVPVGDARALAVAMRRLAGDRAMVERMGAAGRALAERRYDARRVDAAILDSLGL